MSNDPYMVRCESCGHEFDYDDPGSWPAPVQLRPDKYAACPRCGGKLVSVEELDEQPRGER
jgi:DNA-directed RNA polymerase subunit RPC12/RpoP